MYKMGLAYVSVLDACMIEKKVLSTTTIICIMIKTVYLNNISECRIIRTKLMNDYQYKKDDHISIVYNKNKLPCSFK